MITVNSSGSPISAGFVSALTADNRTYDAKILLSGTELDCSVSRITVTKGSCGSTDAFTVGNVIGSTLTAEVKGLSTSVKGKELEVRIGVEVNGSFEYVTLGYFWVSEAPSTAYATTITAYGATLSKTGDVFTAPQTQTLGNIASTIATSASALAGKTITVTFDGAINTSKTITAPMINMTCYQALEILASVCGGYAVDTYNGNIKICRFSDTPNLSRDTSTMKNLPVFEESNFEITGVKVIVSEETQDEEGTTVPAVIYPTTPTGDENLIMQNQYVTQDLYTSYLATLAGYEYRPATVGLTYGDPRVEGVDVLSVTNIDSSVYVVPCHMVTHVYSGGFSTEIVSAKATQQANDVASGSNLTQQLSSIGSNLISARTSAETAKAYAEEAKQTTDEINAYAEVAGKTVTQILQDGETAGESAQQALQSANIAYNSASQAIKQLSIVEDIVGVLDLIATNGVYAITQDTEVKADKWYFEVTGTAVTPDGTEDPHALGWYELASGVYSLTEDTTVASGKIYYTITASPVLDPTDVDIGTYYELINIDQTIQNYVSSHLVLAGNTLSLQNGATRLALSTDPTIGLTFYNDGQQIAQYGATAVVGDPNNYHIVIQSNRLSFYSDIGTEVAYIDGDQLYIAKSVVIQQMDVGDSNGQWSWKIHQVNSQNNLYLKWLG